MTPTMRRLLTAAVLSAGVMLSTAPAALAGPPPDPGPAPAPPADGGTSPAGTASGCAGSEVMQDGNCVPAMTSVPDTAGGGAQEPVPMRISDTESSTTTTGIGADLVPDLNGTPCSGYWSSMACEAQGAADLPAIQPRSTLSSSP